MTKSDTCALIATILFAGEQIEYQLVLQHVPEPSWEPLTEEQAIARAKRIMELARSTTPESA